MKQCIDQIIENVKNKYYGSSSLDPTGPGVLGKQFNKEERKRLVCYHDVLKKKNETIKYIVKRNKIIMQIYSNYYNEQNSTNKQKYYPVMWNERTIYS
jgi:hypothetical protein